MKIFSYIRYFAFLAWNWNLRIAFFLINYEIKGEKKYGIQTTGADELKSLQTKGIDITHATIYMPANYFMLEKVMEEISKHPHNKTFLDLGCGKGRAMAAAAHYGFKKITGVDFSKQFCNEANANMELVQKKITGVDFKILLQDAFYYEIPADVTTIFFFNPFDEVIMSGVVENILRSLEKNPRTIRVIYINPMQKELFIEAGFTEIFHYQKLKWLQACILEKRT